MVETVTGVAAPRGATRHPETLYRAGEVTRWLGVDGWIKYPHMRQLLALARGTKTPLLAEGRNWAKYSIEEVTAVSEALRLLRAQSGITEGPFPIRLRKLRAACDRLVAAGYATPLVDASLEWDTSSGAFVIRLEGYIADASTGQARLEIVLAMGEQRLALEEKQRFELRREAVKAMNRSDLMPNDLEIIADHVRSDVKSTIALFDV